jgi:hypothetical protein
MKSSLWLATASVLFCGIAGATSFSCTPFPVFFPNGGGAAGQTQVVTCAGFTPDPGFDLTSVTLTYVADYEYATVTPADVQVQFTPTGLAGVVFTPPTGVVDVTGNFSSGNSLSASAIAGSFTNTSFASGFSVNVNSKAIIGTVLDSAAGVNLTWNESPSGVPEPGSMALLGLGLVGIGLVRFKVAK